MCFFSLFGVFGLDLVVVVVLFDLYCCFLCVSLKVISHIKRGAELLLLHRKAVNIMIL